MKWFSRTLIALTSIFLLATPSQAHEPEANEEAGWLLMGHHENNNTHVVMAKKGNSTEEAIRHHAEEGWNLTYITENTPTLGNRYRILMIFRQDQSKVVRLKFGGIVDRVDQINSELRKHSGWRLVETGSVDEIGLAPNPDELLLYLARD